MKYKENNTQRRNPMALKRKDIVMKINTETGLPQKACSKIVDSIFEIMKDELANGNQVKISGFGQWNEVIAKVEIKLNLQSPVYEARV